MIKTFYFEPFNLAIVKVKWFQVLLCITSDSIKHQSFVYTQLNYQIVLFLTIQFSMSFVSELFKCQIVLFDPLRGPFQVPSLQARVMAMKVYSTFPKAPALFSVISRALAAGGEFYPSAEMKLVYSTVPSDWAVLLTIFRTVLRSASMKCQILMFIIIRWFQEIFYADSWKYLFNSCYCCGPRKGH